MDKRTIEAIETKAAQIRRPFRINPDRFVRWGLVGGALLGVPAGIAIGIANCPRWDAVGGLLLPGVIGGVMIGGLLGGMTGVVVSLLYEAFLAVLDFVERLRRSKIDNDEARWTE